MPVKQTMTYEHQLGKRGGDVNSSPLRLKSRSPPRGVAEVLSHQLDYPERDLNSQFSSFGGNHMIKPQPVQVFSEGTKDTSSQGRLQKSYNTRSEAKLRDRIDKLTMDTSALQKRTVVVQGELDRVYEHKRDLQFKLEKAKHSAEYAKKLLSGEATPSHSQNVELHDKIEAEK